MHDYREERNYKLFLILFVVFHCQKNKTGKNVLSLKKFEVIYYLLQNQATMKEFFQRLELGDLVFYNKTLYDVSSRISDYIKVDNIGVNISYLCSLSKIRLINIDGVNYLESNNIDDSIFDDGASNFLKGNINKIKKLASLSEPKLLKSIVGL